MRKLRKPDGSLDWKLILIGPSWKKFISSTMLFIAILAMAYGYYDTNKTLQDIEQNPCDYIINITRACQYQQTQQQLNPSNFNIEFNLTQNDTTKKEESPTAT